MASEHTPKRPGSIGAASRRPAGRTRRASAAAAVCTAFAVGVGSAGMASAAAAPGAPAVTVSLDELAVGQRGYGLSVFAGGEPRRFTAEVVGVIRNVAPDTSYILARLSGEGLEASGVVAGMSGSPVFFDDRLAGAVAFSWPFSRDAIAGITPIDAMRRIPMPAPSPPADSPPAPVGPDAVAGPGAIGPGGRPPVPLADLVAGRVPADLVDRELARLKPVVSFGAAPGIGWSLAGFGPAGEALLGRWLGPLAPAGAAAAPATGGLAPGGSVAAVLIDGDFRLAATGTVTDVDGDGVLAFGHPFLGLGPIRLPMAYSEVVTVLSNQQTSFKIANLGPVVGAFEEDRQAGVRGRLGAEAPMIPLRLAVRGGEAREFRMRLAAVPQITPVLLAISSLSGLGAASYTGGAQGLDLAARFHLAGGGELQVEQSFDGVNAAPEAAAHLLAFAGFLLQNDFAEVELVGIDVELDQFATPRTATLVGAHAERTVVRPGDRVGLNLDFYAYRGEPFRRTVSIDLPEDLPSGRYFLFVGDGSSVDAARLAVERAQPVNLRQALDLLRSLHSRRELVVIGMLEGAGLAVAGEVLPNLPGSVRSLWSAAATGSALPLRLAVTQERAEPMATPVEGLVRIDLRILRREAVTAEGGDGDVAPANGGAKVEEGAAPSPPPPAAAPQAEAGR